MKKVLVIDDDIDIIYLIKDILEDEGYEVVISAVHKMLIKN